jgi:hypothetical protein
MAGAQKNPDIVKGLMLWSTEWTRYFIIPPFYHL